jgi:hypothetical protein
MGTAILTLTLTLLGAREAFAGATVDLLFVEKNGSQISATDTIIAAPGDELKMSVIMTNDQPLTAAIFSLNYDLDGKNELDVVSAEQWEGVQVRATPPPPCFFQPVAGMQPPTDTFVGSFQGFVTCLSPAAVPLPRAGGANPFWVMGTVTWKVNSGVSTDGADI